MSVYVLQVRPGTEQSVCGELERMGFTALCPMKEMFIRFRGKWDKKTYLIFTQYIFVECELNDENYYRIKSVDGYIRFLGYGKPEPLSNCEEAYIRLLHNGGKPVEASKIYVTSTGDKMVMSGFLRKYQHDMVELNLRQRRAKVIIKLCGKDYRITLPVVPI